MATQTTYNQLSGLRDPQFKRLTGVQRTTFAAMTEILTAADVSPKARGGRASKLYVEDRLLMALKYLREYPTYFRLGQSYGVSESIVFKICRWVEDILVKDKRFALPGRKALLKSDMQYEVLLVDASESPVA